ncbi:glycine zipper 2TM domain-containing protein [Polaromonas jejuensis]|uniref:Glycine zipper 2TM domain-containing protein n=1 Tax=Polaromonas jejuensis TaxID=457502 RepID=A0ABW0QF94_9BURK|nr:glycine zipper 2TM domain-containing protein [Polaromonas jejuensis]
MKRSAILCLTALLAAGVQAQSFNDTARVRNVNPQYENISVPRNECTSQWVIEPQPVAASRNYGGLALGGVAGALLGNQVGNGHGREAATAVGAVVGALAGEHFANQNGWGGYEQAAPQQRQVQSCRTVNDVQTRLTGYQVEYEYRGQVYSTVTRENPGRTLPVRVSVAPVEPAGREFQGAREYQGRRDDRGDREYYGAYNR